MSRITVYGTMSTGKRPLDADENDSKRIKHDENDQDIDDDLKYLKLSIKAEILLEFDSKFSTLQGELLDLKKKYDTLLANPVASSSTTSSNESTKIALERKLVDNDKPPQHKFGNTSFNFKPTTATPMNSMKEPDSNVNTPTAPNTTNSSPKPVFGATTSFGNNSVLENMKNKKSVLDNSPSTASSSTSILSSTGDVSNAGFKSNEGISSSFGANSRFGNAFQNSLKKKSFLDNAPSKDKTQESTPEEQEDNQAYISGQKQQYKQVDLAPVNNTTGEEHEKSHFTATCKLFELNLNKLSEGWRERGLGQLHLNQSYHDSKQVRLVMRSHGLLRVILNTKVTPDTELFKGLDASLSPGKYLRFNYVNEEGGPIQYLLKFGNPTVRDELVDKIEDLKDQILKLGSSSKSDKKESSTNEKPNGVQWL